MVDEQQPAKKVVKRVVKKTVARPAAAMPAKTIRYGRPVPARTTKPQAKVASKLASTPAVRTGGAKTLPAQPRVDVGAKVGAAGRAVSSRGSRVGSAVAGGVGVASRTAGTFVAVRSRAVLAWRIPHVESRLAAVITGTSVGLLAVGLGLVSLQVFSEVRGVSSGGGRWGSLTFVVVTLVAFVVGDLLLSAFGSAHARLTSFLGVVLTIVAMLAFFLGLADSRWALVLVPALAAAAYLTSHLLLVIAESSPTIPE